VERSRRVLENPRIEKLNLEVGPMSLSGSTRLQASTVLMLGAGAALLRDSPPEFPAIDLPGFLEFLRQLDTSFLVPFIEAESAIYQRGEYVLYETDRYGITILTDTTERAPTFSLPGFENNQDPERRPSASFLCLTDAEDAASAWRQILLREPITLEWKGMAPVAGRKRLMGFDFSRKGRAAREALLEGKRQYVFHIFRQDDALVMQLGEHEARLDVSSLHPLCEHLLLKLLLNTHSTLLMGRVGRYESNLMTWVRPSNSQLIDRAIRYIAHLLERSGVRAFSYEDIAYECFARMQGLAPDESIVMKTVFALRARAPGKRP
jgi:N-acetylmuramic acid 6-phosphate etherase